MSAADKLAAMPRVVQIVLKGPMRNSRPIANQIDPVMMTVMARRDTIGEFGPHRRNHSLASLVTPSRRVIDEHEIFDKACPQALPILRIESVPVLGLKPLYSPDVLQIADSPLKILQRCHAIPFPTLPYGRLNPPSS